MTDHMKYIGKQVLAVGAIVIIFGTVLYFYSREVYVSGLPVIEYPYRHYAFLMIFVGIAALVIGAVVYDAGARAIERQKKEQRKKQRPFYPRPASMRRSRR